MSELDMWASKQGTARERELEQQIVWGFYEEQYPSYHQGPEGAHELTSPITAEEANNLVKRIRELEEVMRAIVIEAADVPHGPMTALARIEATASRVVKEWRGPWRRAQAPRCR